MRFMTFALCCMSCHSCHLNSSVMCHLICFADCSLRPSILTTVISRCIITRCIIALREFHCSCTTEEDCSAYADALKEVR
ncbi:hypothetical protein KP509_11G018700 [Ceratopteris richardii]|uniref:Secreted protein n=1 Tax=Ceratopteris richardii TaxID=49495 RepID=A0A8T2TPI7_CERRI|nr:hypothetical protein KP509_11G018700 [Ceratopteris richardii]